MASEPVKLGSALEDKYIFQKGSSVTISSSGIQECSIKAYWPNGATVLDNIPAAGTTYDAIFGNSYLPADFKLDLSENGSAQIEYLEGKTAQVTFSFKRPDPSKDGKDASRKVSFDSSFVFKSINEVAFGLDASLDGAQSMGAWGFPEPVVTLEYNNPTLPNIGGSLYALPGSAQALGFPTTSNITLNVKLINWTDIPAQAGDVVTLQILFAASPLGWQQTGIKAQPVAGESFFDVTENWRTFYIFKGCTVSSTVHFTGGNIQF